LEPSVKAENGQTYNVGTSNLNVRSSPSNKGQVIGQLDYGNQVVVFKETNGWGQTYYDGEEAWVALHYLYTNGKSEQANSTSVSATNVTVSANSVRIRSGPSTDHQMIGSTSQGESFQLLDTKDGWHQISLSNGKTGWIAGWLTTLSSDNTSASDKQSNPVVVKAATTDTPTPKAKKSQSLAGYNIILDPGH